MSNSTVQKSWISRKPRARNEVWSSGKARNARTKLKQREKDMRESLQGLQLPENLFDILFASDGLPEFTKIVGKIKLFKKSVNSAITKGYVIEEPTPTEEEKKTEERKVSESQIDEGLLARLKAKIGHGRQAQTFKFEHETRSVFNQTLIREYPLEFLKDKTTRNTLRTLYDSIDLSGHQLKQKEIDEKKPKELNEREWNKEFERIAQHRLAPQEFTDMSVNRGVAGSTEEEKRLPKKRIPKKPKPEPEPETSDSESSKPSAEELLSQVDEEIPGEQNYEALGDAELSEDMAKRKLSLATMKRRFRKNHKNYLAYKSKLDTLSPLDNLEDYITTKANKDASKKAFKQYKAMIRDYEENLELAKTLESEEDEISSKQSHIVMAMEYEKPLDLNEFYQAKQNQHILTCESASEDLSIQQLNTIRDELKVYLGVAGTCGNSTSRWLTEGKELDEYEYYDPQAKDHTPEVIIPVEFRDMYYNGLLKSERENEYPKLVKRMKKLRGRMAKLPKLSEAANTHPKTIEKLLEELYKEMKKEIKKKD